MRFLSHRIKFVVGSGCLVALLALLLNFGGSEVITPLATESQRLLVGGGTGYACDGVMMCPSACVPSGGCTYHEYFGGVIWWCSCTTPGNDGCLNSGTMRYCAPSSGSNCDPAGGTPACGGPHYNDDVLIVWYPAGGTWICNPACFPGGSAMCRNCS